MNEDGHQARPCSRCDGVHLEVTTQTFRDGTTHRRVTCKRCGGFCGYLPKRSAIAIPTSTEPSLPAASQRSRFDGAAVARGDCPPDWRASFVQWRLDLQRRFKDDRQALAMAEEAAELFWQRFEDEVEGRL